MVGALAWVSLYDPTGEGRNLGNTHPRTVIEQLVTQPFSQNVRTFTYSRTNDTNQGVHAQDLTEPLDTNDHDLDQYTSVSM